MGISKWKRDWWEADVTAPKRMSGEREKHQFPAELAQRIGWTICPIDAAVFFDFSGLKVIRTQTFHSVTMLVIVIRL